MRSGISLALFCFFVCFFFFLFFFYREKWDLDSVSLEIANKRMEMRLVFVLYLI